MKVTASGGQGPSPDKKDLLWCKTSGMFCEVINIYNLTLLKRDISFD